MFGIDYNVGGQERSIANTLTARNNVNGISNVRQEGTAVCIPFALEYKKGQIGKEADTAHCLCGEFMTKEGTMSNQTTERVCIPVLTPDRAEKRQNGRRMKDNGEEAFTLTAQDIHGVAISQTVKQAIPIIWYDKYKCYIAIRKLTPKECFRLQGWSDDYFEKAQFVNSDSQLYKQAGNGVTVNVVEDIARAMTRAANE